MKQAVLQERIERRSKRKRLITLVPFRHYFDSLVILASITEFPRTKRFPAPTPAGSGSGNRDRERRRKERGPLERKSAAAEAEVAGESGAVAHSARNIEALHCTCANGTS